jgi:hypothetical protein
MRDEPMQRLDDVIAGVAPEDATALHRVRSRYANDLKSLTQ